MRGEKRPLFKKEAQEEALHFGVISRDDDDDEYPSFSHDKENLPATNIDDVKISIIDDEVDGHSPKPAKKHRDSSPERTKDKSHRESLSGKKDRDKDKTSQEKHAESKKSRDSSMKDIIRKSTDVTVIVDHSEGKRKDSENQKHNDIKSVSDVSGKNERNDAHSPRNSEHSSHTRDLRPDSHAADKPREPSRERDSRERSLSPPDPHHRPVNPVGRAGSFIKNRDSPRRMSRDTRGDAENNSVPGSGPAQPSTLPDLKKQRSENHKFGTGVDAQVQNLFLHSLSGAGNKYSSGTSQPPETQNKKESAQNGRNVKNNNNNNNSSGSSRPPTFISDSGPLRRFSAPTSHPVIGEDDKFKNDCCVIL